MLGATHLASSARIGSSGSPVGEVHSTGGCSYAGGALASPCTSSQRVCASTSGTTPPDVAKPTVDLDTWYANASPGPSNPCTPDSISGGFDNDSTRNDSLTDFDLTPGSAYTCATSSGELTYSPGTVTIDGTINFDGDIVLSNSALIQGRATIYASGTIRIENSVELCGISGGTSSWDPSTNLLVSMSGASTDAVGFLLRDSAKFQGAVYAVQDAKFSGTSEFWGTAVVDEAIIKGSASVNYKSLGTLLSSMPLPGSGTASSTLILENVAGSFSPS